MLALDVLLFPCILVSAVLYDGTGWVLYFFIFVTGNPKGYGRSTRY